MKHILSPIAVLGTCIPLVIISPQLAHSNSLSPYKINEIAKEITVLLWTPAGSGSGAIIGKDKDTNNYFVLTAGHVVDNIYPGEETNIQTHDGKIHSLNTDQITHFEDVDLALVTFTSDNDYPIPTIDTSAQVQELSQVYVAGYPLPGNAMRQKFHITTGNITGIDTFNEQGYDLVYSNVTRAGMSGGPILNQEGEIIGIHGRAEGSQLPDGTIVKQGFNLGMPIEVFLEGASQSKINLANLNLQIDSTITPITLEAEKISSSNAPNSAQSFPDFVERYYSILPTLIEAMEPTALESHYAIHMNQESFRLKTKVGSIQNYQTTMVKMTEVITAAKARGEMWQVSYAFDNIEMLDDDSAVISLTETVNWSYWPGLIRGVVNRNIKESWKLINGQWQIIYAEEVAKF